MNWVMRAAENVLSHVPGSGKIPELARRVRAHSSKALQDSFYDLMLEGNSQQATKRALLSYIVDPFKIPEDDPRFLRHINIWHSREMVRALNRMGYVVDVIDYRNTDLVPRRAYDLFIGHGGINFESIAQTLQENCVRFTSPPVVIGGFTTNRNCHALRPCAYDVGWFWNQIDSSGTVKRERCRSQMASLVSATTLPQEPTRGSLQSL